GFTAISVGSVGLRKGTYDLLAGWRAFVEQVPRVERRDLKLLVCGLPDGQDPPGFSTRDPEAPHRPSILEIEFDRTPQVERVVWQDMRQMPAWYRQAHLYLCVSHEEGSIMSGVEAALSGCALAYVRESGIDVPGTFHLKDRAPSTIAGALLAARQWQAEGKLGPVAEATSQRWAR